ncbi:MAG TPA: hypothetical protein VJ955_05115 [Desulfuromonadales bacterium]|nr:hypothetical protein [Desulfuromonadales bacterium]
MEANETVVKWEPGEREELWRQMQDVWRLREDRRRPLPLIGLLGVMFLLAFGLLAAHDFSTRPNGLTGVQVASDFTHQRVVDHDGVGVPLSMPMKNNQL